VKLFLVGVGDVSGNLPNVKLVTGNKVWDLAPNTFPAADFMTSPDYSQLGVMFLNVVKGLLLFGVFYQNDLEIIIDFAFFCHHFCFDHKFARIVYLLPERTCLRRSWVVLLGSFFHLACSCHDRIHDIYNFCCQLCSIFEYLLQLCAYPQHAHWLRILLPGGHAHKHQSYSIANRHSRFSYVFFFMFHLSFVFLFRSLSCGAYC
jgi:hypothetical protein